MHVMGWDEGNVNVYKIFKWKDGCTFVTGLKGLFELFKDFWKPHKMNKYIKKAT